MVESFPDLAVNLIYTVLCLVPGFVSLQTAIYIADLNADMGEFEKSTWIQMRRRFVSNRASGPANSTRRPRSSD
jgi:hypothetical protein